MEIEKLAIQNPWWSNRSAIDADPKIMDFEQAKIKWVPRIVKYIPLDRDVVCSVRGPRQVGKTTMIKLIVRDHLRKQDFVPSNLFYYACDQVPSAEQLTDIINSYLDWSARLGQGRKLIFLDEISSVKEWQKAIKSVIDQRSNRNMTILISGSHSVDIKHSVERLPGRTGEQTGQSTHKILLPMKFAEYVENVHPEIYAKPKELGLDRHGVRSKEFLSLMAGNMPASAEALRPLIPKLSGALEEYLIHGGMMPALNQFKKENRIPASIYELYVRSLLGDVAKVGRQERIARQIIGSLLKKMGSCISWNSIAKDSEISSPLTAQQYAELLEAMFVLDIFFQVDINSGQPKPRSEKKAYVPNPFIFHALRGWAINPAGDYFQASIDFLNSDKDKSFLLEAVLGDHLARAAYNLKPSDVYEASSRVFFFHTKKREEADFVLKHDGVLYPFELKYQNSISSSDYIVLRKFRKGVLISKDQFKAEQNYATIPLPLFLMYI